MRYGLVDIGSNSVRLVVYDVENGEMRVVASEKETAGLVSYIRRGHMQAEGVLRLVEILERFHKNMLAIGAESVCATATACLRNISNTDSVVEEVERQTGLRIRVLSGAEESMLAFYGNLPLLEPGSHLLVDLGGGSLECIRVVDKQPAETISLPFGSLGLYKKFVERILPTKSEGRDIRSFVRAQLAGVGWLGGETETLYAVGGSARALGKLYREFVKDIDGAIASADVLKLYDKVSDLGGRGVHRFVRAVPERLHVTIPGMAVFVSLLKATGAKRLRVSPFGLRDGVMRRIAEGRGLGRDE